MGFEEVESLVNQTETIRRINTTNELFNRGFKVSVAGIEALKRIPKLTCIHSISLFLGKVRSGSGADLGQRSLLPLDCDAFDLMIVIGSQPR